MSRNDDANLDGRLGGEQPLAEKDTCASITRFAIREAAAGFNSANRARIVSSKRNVSEIR